MRFFVHVESGDLVEDAIFLLELVVSNECIWILKCGGYDETDSFAFFRLHPLDMVIASWI